MRQLVRTLIEDTLERLRAEQALSYTALPRYAVELPKNPAHGDFACNIAMLLKAPPLRATEIADLIVSRVLDRHGVLRSIERAGPGFLDLRLSDAAFQAVAREILVQGDDFGRSRAPNPKRVLVEFVSANPTGPVHIGHARGAFMGDAIARLLRAAGHDVTREFYINDHGLQVETLGRTVYKRYQELFGAAITLAEGEYPAPYVIEIARAWRAEIGDRFLEASEAEWLPAAIAVGIRENLKAIRACMVLAGIEHDHFFSEAALHAEGKVKAIVESYRQRGVTYEASEGLRKDPGSKQRSADSKAARFGDRQLGGTFLRTASFTDAQGKHSLPDDEDRVILRHDGSPVYLTADLAYHNDKFERGYDRMVDVLGADHSGHVPRILAGMQLLGHDPKRLDFVLVQIVRITRGGEEVKVSKRKGTLFELSELLEEASGDVCRFMFLMRTRDAQFDFDLDLVQQQSKENPVFYFQYGHARCASLLRKAEARGKPFVGVAALTDRQLASLVRPEEHAMLKQMSRLPDLIANAADKLEPHHVLYFCQDLIADFHSYFTNTKSDPIIGPDPDKTQGRLALVAALKQTLRSAFGVLGIHAPEEMLSPDKDDAADE